MEVLMHEASNQQENNAVCIVEPKSTFKKREDDIPSDAAHSNDKESVDIIFENITYTVSHRFRRGKLFSNSFCYILD